MIGKAKEEVKKEIMREMRGFRGSGHQAMKFAEQLMARSQSGVDIGYLKTLLFPELYNADVPQPLSTQSYCRFTDKKEFSIRGFGSGMLLWYPKTTNGPQLFIRYGNLQTPCALDIGAVAFPAGAAALTTNVWQAGGFMDYSAYFSQANLVAASLQIQYIGQLQNEQGFFVGSQLYGVSPSTVTSDDIENGQFRLMERPGDGVRCVYMPKDTQDFTYYQVSKGVSKNNGSRQAGTTVNIPSVDTLAVPTAFIEGVIPSNWVTNTGTVAAPVYKANYLIQYSVEADFIAIYWKGLNFTQSEDLRIDIVRKFNGFPLASQRDILDLQKPKKIFDPKKTIDVVQELQDAIPQLCGHSIKAMDRVSDELQEFLPNVGHLYNEGLLKEGTTLRGLTDQLQAVNGMEGSVIVPGRLYD